MTVYTTAAGQAALERAEKLLEGIPKGISTAVNEALGRTASRLRTSSSKAIRERYDISAANIRAEENVRITRSYRGSGVQAAVTFSGKRIPLHRFGGASPGSPRPDTGKLVRAKIYGQWLQVHPGAAASGHQLKSTSPYHFQKYFVAQMKSGHTGIFKRTGGVTEADSDEIKEIMGSSVPQMLGSDPVAKKLDEQAVETFEKRLEHNISAILNGNMGVRT